MLASCCAGGHLRCALKTSCFGDCKEVSLFLDVKGISNVASSKRVQGMSAFEMRSLIRSIVVVDSVG